MYCFNNAYFWSLTPPLWIDVLNHNLSAYDLDPTTKSLNKHRPKAKRHALIIPGMRSGHSLSSYLYLSAFSEQWTATIEVKPSRNKWGNNRSMQCFMRTKWEPTKCAIKTEQPKPAAFCWRCFQCPHQAHHWYVCSGSIFWQMIPAFDTICIWQSTALKFANCTEYFSFYVQTQSQNQANLK